ncbi:MAG: hypothetical protein BJ554DRAFT_6204 [Olpidium bornovanus]|uniref:Cation efflux protein transmembrane domain-containing protein n=1 Tax=Olpidium bornovanus TaxID=278681 RepID=A0A8H7ZYC7_9FUNG|nr:MAG: hypothetical protein BJ554DRAFT_6204 [Olpidium bornovanus]
MACTVDVSESRLVRRPGREDDEFKNRTGQRVVMPAANALNTPPPDFPSCPDLGPGSTVAPADLHSLRFTDIAPYPTVFSAVDRRAGQRSSRSADYEAGDGYDPLYPPPRSLGACGDSETVAVHLSHSAQELSILLRPAAESLGITYESRGKLSHLMASKPTGHVSIELSEQPAVPEKASGALDAGTTNRNAAANFSVTSTPTCVATDLHSDNGGDGRRRQSGLPNALGAANDQLLTEDNKVEADARANMKRLKTAIALCSVFFVVELCGGLFAGSLALLSDSFHLLSDCVSFVISLLAIRLSRKKSTKGTIRGPNGWMVTVL